jgi:hypothetical protein
MRLTKAAKQADREKRERHRRECEAIRAGGKCPQCGRALKYNNALAGTFWYQCVGVGAEGFRQGAECGFQILWPKD